MAKRKGFSDVIENTDLDKDRDGSNAAGTSGTATNIKTGYVKPSTKNKMIHRADAKRCRPWKYADRNKLWFNENNCADLIHGFNTIGQEMPALARRIDNDPDFDFEIILGNRRRWTAEYCAKPLELEITTNDDATCFLRMDSENDDREDISPFERACSYSRSLEQGVFSSARQLASARNIGVTFLSEQINAAKITRTKLIDLFGDVRDIPIKPAAKLMMIWHKNTELQGAILAKAHFLQNANESLPAAKIIKLLIDSTKDKAPEKAAQQYEDAKGQARVKASAKNNEVTLKISTDGINKRDLKKLINQAIGDFI